MTFHRHPSHTNTHTHTRARAHTQHFWMDMTVLWFQGLGPPLSTRFSNTRWEAFHQNYGDDHVVMRVMIVRKADCNTGWHVISQGARLRNDITSKTIACLRVMPFYNIYLILLTITYRILLLCIWIFLALPGAVYVMMHHYVHHTFDSNCLWLGKPIHPPPQFHRFGSFTVNLPEIFDKKRWQMYVP